MDSTDLFQLLPEEFKHLFLDVRNGAGKEKVVIGLEKQKHLTIHFGFNSGVLDLHITDESIDGADKYTTLIKIDHSNGKVLLDKIRQIFIEEYQSGLLSCINLGKLNRHNCILMEVDQKTLLYHELLKKKKSKVKFNRSFKTSHLIDTIRLPSDRFTPPNDKIFQVLKIKKNSFKFQGFILFPNHIKTRRPYFLKQSRINKLKRRVLLLFLDYVDAGMIEMDERYLKQLKG